MLENGGKRKIFLCKYTLGIEQFTCRYFLELRTLPRTTCWVEDRSYRRPLVEYFDRYFIVLTNWPCPLASQTQAQEVQYVSGSVYCTNTHILWASECILISSSMMCGFK